MVVHSILVSVLKRFSISYNLLVFVPHLENFVLYLPCACVILPLNYHYICVRINIFTNIISMFTSVIFLLHTIYSLVVLHIGKCEVHISCILFVMPLLPSSLNCIHKSGLTYLCLNELLHGFLISQYLIHFFLL